ncbi:MAG: FAD-dependent oxidoreductase [Proteobacteria bacterium]|nr:FAD-dependent oxidoreductase [Pseudomonadota bacterium]
MKNQAQIVVIGGGITGCSIAYHLALMGAKDVLLIEKGELTSGSTCHAAGLVTSFDTSPSILKMRMYSADLYAELHENFGKESGWHGTGSLRLASGDTQLKILKRAVSQAKGLGSNSHIITPEEAKRYWPHISLEDVEGAIYLEKDGWLDPHSMANLLAKKATEMGVEIQVQTRVTNIQLSPKNEVVAVETDRGLIKCETVINAAGMWAPRIAEMVGILMPMIPVKHQHLTTTPLKDYPFPEDTPVLRDRKNLIYIREEVRGLLIGGFETEPAAWNPEGVPWDHSQQSLNPDWDQFESIMEGAILRIPILEEADVGELVNHPDAMTPDGYPCVGPSPQIPGFWGAAGLSLNGFGMGGGLGRIIAEWLIEGHTDVDMTPFDIRRFGKHYKNLDFITQRGKETYKYYYYNKFPFDEWEWGRPYRTSPLYERLKESGAVFGEKSGFERVIYFEPDKPWRTAGRDQGDNWQWAKADFIEVVREEHEAIRNGVGLLDMSSFGKIDIDGPDALKFLQKIAANEIDKPVGSLIYTQFLNPQGGIESDLTIGRTGKDSFRLITGTSSLSIDMGWLLLNKDEGDSVTIEDVTEKFACISVWGPESRKVLSQITSSDVSNEGFPYLNTQEISINGSAVRANRVSFSGELGWEIYPEKDIAVSVWDMLMEAGKAFNIRPCGYYSIDSLRLEKGYLYWGSDLTAKDDPLSAGLGFAVKTRKGNFIGRDAIIKIKEKGLQRKMCTLVLNTDNCSIYGGEAVFSQGEAIGRIRTGGYGYTVDKNIAFSYLPIEWSQPGTELEVESFGERVSMQVVKGPLYDPKGEKIR